MALRFLRGNPRRMQSKDKPLNTAFEHPFTIQYALPLLAFTNSIDLTFSL